MKVALFIVILKKMGKELVVEIKPKESNLKFYFAWLVIAAGISLAALASGFALGKSGQLPLPQEKTATTGAIRAGWSALAGIDFSIQYPKDWQAKEYPAGEIPGAKLTNPGGSVDFWLKVERPYQFAPEQKDGQTGKKEGTIAVGGRSGTMTEFSYQSGGFFLIIEVPATKKEPKVTFWATAANEEYKKTVLDIIASFKTKVETP